MLYENYEAVIGIEIHAQLRTNSKMFCSDSTAFNAADNDNVSPLSCGMPGTLPVYNKKAIEYSVKTGLALKCKIRNRSVFARKNYFYPDLPKGYQISQYEEPLCENGYVEFYIGENLKRVDIIRAHMEEDAGKSIHYGEYSLINYNRSGIPLLEIVSGPDMNTPEEAGQYARTIRQVLRYLEVCDGNLEEGSLRCDCNVSIRKKGDPKLGTKVELKNINSFRFVEKALEYEISRQIDCMESGEKIVQETRLYDSAKNKTYTMRMKENADDYRYFPDPDLLPVYVSNDWIEGINKKLPELPLERAKRFEQKYKLPKYDALVLTQEKDIADYFEEVVKECNNPKSVSNWIMVELMRELKNKEASILDCSISTKNLGKLIKLVDTKVISGKMAKMVFSEMYKSGRDADIIIKEKNLIQITDESAIENIIDQVISQNQDKVEEYNSGKAKLFGFFVGQVMRLSKGQANPQIVNEILEKNLQKYKNK